MAMVHTTSSTDLSRKLRISSSSGSGLSFQLTALASFTLLLAARLTLVLLECLDKMPPLLLDKDLMLDGPDRREWTEPEE